MPDSVRLRVVAAGRFVTRTMSSLRHLLAAHGSLLLLDAASTRVQVGWFSDGDPAHAKWQVADEEAGTGVFRCVEQLGVDVNMIRAFAFCDGPGSILGIRTTAMALRTWQVLAPRPVFAYCSLALVAESLGRDDLTIIADARRDLWHALTRGRALRRVPKNELAGELVMPENFRHWSPLPADVRQVPYSLAELLPRVAEADLFRATDAPDAFLHEEPSYATWTPQIHRAPA
jgi:tRNA threonylcarbamoyladenosine biosynthesis protein TsaB